MKGITTGLTRGMRRSNFRLSINMLKTGTVLGTLDRGNCTRATCGITMRSACPS